MYYLDQTTPNSTTIFSTYDEGRAGHAQPGSPYSWYQPYNGTPLAVTDEDILVHTGDVKVRGKMCRKVQLRTRWHITNMLAPVAPGKKVATLGGLPPYNTREGYWAMVSEFPADVSVGRAVAALKKHWVRNSPLEQAKQYYLDIEGDHSATVQMKRYRQLRELLTPLVLKADLDNEIGFAIDNALPPHLPPPDDHEMSGLSVTNSERITWRWWTMYILAMGIALDKL